MTSETNELDPTPMFMRIDHYLDYDLESSYESACYYPEGGHRDDEKPVYYDYKTTNKFIDDYKEGLMERMNKVEKFRYLINKKLFSNERKEYLLKLYDDNNEMFYKIMNDECKFKDENIGKWNEISFDHGGYCCEKDGNRIICENCRFFLDIVGEQLIRFYTNYE